jgi:hypothetical protein
LLILTFILFGCVFAQKQAVKSKSASKIEKSAQIEISDAEWKVLFEAFAIEYWNNVVNLSINYLKKLPIENSKKQIAKLNYLYIFALGGKVAKGDLEFDEFDKILQTFVGKQF